MESHPRISKLLVETGAFTDLEHPVILTSGELGIYYINTEKLCQDDGEFKQYGNDSQAMIQHAIRMTQQRPIFEEVIEIIANKVRSIPGLGGRGRFAISGGQRRDWLFSGPVALSLGIPHISLYKQRTGEPDKVEVVYPDGDVCRDLSLNGMNSVHIADLLTEGSSCYRRAAENELGWIPMQRRRGATISNLVAVVDRLQGGGENLAKQGVKVSAFVAIDQDFLRTHSKEPERAVSYAEDPRAWSEDYLTNNGALALIETFDPEGGKSDRAAKFIKRYGDFLHEAGKWGELDLKVQRKFGIKLGPGE